MLAGEKDDVVWAGLLSQGLRDPHTILRSIHLHLEELGGIQMLLHGDAFGMKIRHKMQGVL